MTEEKKSDETVEMKDIPAAVVLDDIKEPIDHTVEVPPMLTLPASLPTSFPLESKEIDSKFTSSRIRERSRDIDLPEMVRSHREKLHKMIDEGQGHVSVLAESMKIAGSFKRLIGADKKKLVVQMMKYIQSRFGLTDMSEEGIRDLIDLLIGVEKGNISFNRIKKCCQSMF